MLNCCQHDLQEKRERFPSANSRLECAILEITTKMVWNPDRTDI
jgi:hypothetical protein